MCSFLHEDETIDDLQRGGMRIIQKKNGFRFTMDSVLLADFASISEKAVVADLGSGTGIITLLLHGRNRGSRYHCIEIQQEMTEMCARTVEMNGLSELIQVHNCDVSEAFRYVPDCSVDAVVMNPPYSASGTVIENSKAGQRVSRIHDQDGLLPWFKAAYRMLSGKGKVFCVFPAAQLPDIFQVMRQAHIEPKRLRLVYTRAEKDARLALIEGIKDGGAEMKIMFPLTVFTKDGTVSDEINRIYNEEAQQ